LSKLLAMFANAIVKTFSKSNFWKNYFELKTPIFR
jgi:hypothetical protein